MPPIRQISYEGDVAIRCQEGGYARGSIELLDAPRDIEAVSIGENMRRLQHIFDPFEEGLGEGRKRYRCSRASEDS